MKRDMDEGAATPGGTGATQARDERPALELSEITTPGLGQRREGAIRRRRTRPIDLERRARFARIETR